MLSLKNALQKVPKPQAVKTMQAVLTFIQVREHARTSVLLPVPGSPVMTVIPLGSLIPKSMEVSASAWLGVR
jgi:hypothetical protein